MIDLTGFTPTQIRMLDLMADGCNHSKAELQACMPDEMSGRVDNHLGAMRKLLRPQGQDIACVVDHRRAFYRWVSLCPPAMEALYRQQQQILQARPLPPRAAAS